MDPIAAALAAVRAFFAANPALESELLADLVKLEQTDPNLVLNISLLLANKLSAHNAPKS